MVTQPSRIGAIVLAGGRVPSSLTDRCAHRALLPIHGKCMLEYIVETLQQAPSVVATAIIAPEGALAALPHLPGLKAPSGDTLVDNMLKGSELLAADGVTHLLFITGDIPLLTVESIEAFITDSLASGAVLTYPIIPREACERRFPGAKRTYVRLQDGTFTGGNVVLTTAKQLREQRSLFQELYLARKQPFKLAGLLGWSTVVRMLTGKLSLSYLEPIASRILQGPVKAIITQYPEIGFDIDKVEDLLAVEQVLAIERAR